MSGVVDTADPPYLEGETSVFRQNLRSNLREKEMKLTEMIRASRRNASLSEPLNATSYRLLGGSQNSLRREESFADVLRSKSPDGLDIQDKLLGLEQVSSQQSNRIKLLEIDISRKNEEVDGLRKELVKKLEKIVSLEFELENRAVSLDVTTDSISELDLGSLSNDYDVTNKLSPSDAKVFCSQLLTDLRDLEELYKEERVRSALLQEQLREENSFLQKTIAKRLADLDERLKNNEDERSQLSAAVTEKNREIEALKRELTDLRLNAIAEGGANGSIYGDFDADLLRTTPWRGETFPLEARSLELQLRDANMRIVRKQQEEAVERAKQNFIEQASLLQLALSQRAKATAFLEDEQLDVTVDLDSSFDSTVDRSTFPPSKESRRSLQRDQEMVIARARAASANFGSQSVEGKANFSTPASEEPRRSSGSKLSQQSSRRAVKREQDKAVKRARTLFGLFRLRGGRFTI